MDVLPDDPSELRAWRDATLYRLLLRASRAEVDETIDRLREAGYTNMSFRYASLLANLDTQGTTISALGRKAGMTRQGASQQLMELEREGYVERETSPDDGRVVLVRQTPRGRVLLHDALGVVADIEARYEKLLGKTRFATLKSILADLLAHTDPGGSLGADEHT